MKRNHLSSVYEKVPESAKASFWYTICYVVNKGLALFSTPLFTRILTEEQYGAFTIFYSWYNILSIFMTLNLYSDCYTKGLIIYRDNKGEFTSSLLGLVTLLTSIFGLIYLLNIGFWTSLFEISPVLMIAMFIEILARAAVGFWSTEQRFAYKYKKYVAITLLTSILSLGGGVIAVLSTSYKAEARIISDVAAKSVFGLIMFVLIFVRGKKFFHKEYWIYALKLNIPLLPHFLSFYVLTQSDRIMIGKMVGKKEAAYYGVAYTIATVVELLNSAINDSLTPYVYKSIDGKKNDVKRVTASLFVLIAVMSIIAMALAPEVIYLFAGSKYMEAIYVIPPVATSVFFHFIYSAFSKVVYYYQKTTVIAASTMIAAVINLILNFIFIPRFGYYAAGYTTLVSYIVIAFLNYCFYKLLLKESGELYNIKIIFATLSAVLIFTLIVSSVYQYSVVRYGGVACFGAAALLFRKEIVRIINKYRGME